MKIGLIFPSEFSILSVFQRPLGGSESAVSFLAIELVKLGHQVSLITLSPEVNAFGIQGLRLTIEGNQVHLPKQILEDHYDVLIIKNGLVELGKELKKLITREFKLYFWTGHAFDQPAISGLKDPDIVQEYSAIICVSNWQRETFINEFKIPENKLLIIRNAISPFFENLFLNEQEFLNAKPRDPSLAYSSTPFRGLNILLSIFPKLIKEISSARLQVFSSMKVYGVLEENDDFRELYEEAKKISGISYIGSLMQLKLANKLRECSIFSYPNTFPETSCISVMEAMAAGLYVITTELGALPETTLGFASLIKKESLLHGAGGDFLEELRKICNWQLSNKVEFYEYLYDKTKVINKLHTWRVRARHWLEVINNKV